MKQIGNRIVFDQDGDIIVEFGEYQTDGEIRKSISSLDYIDLDYGSIDFSKYRIIKIDTDTKQPILEEIPHVLTPEEHRIKELEDALLLAEDQLTGGIL